MTEPTLLSNAAGFLILTLSWLRQLALWQRKEYRFDRLWSAISSRERATLTSTSLYVFYGSVAIGWLSYLLSYPALARGLGWLALTGLFLHIAIDIFHRGLLRPKPTKKLLLLAVVSATLMLAYWLLVLMTEEFAALQWATFIYFLPLLITIAVGLTNIPARVKKRQIITSATKLRDTHKSIKVLGITGSFGKTSTKEFLYQIMSNTAKNVLATKEHRNAEFTVAQDMLEQLRSDTNIYIAEMGAYKHGEIAALARLAKPQLGMITAIANQHVSIFGSTEAVANTKWELIKALPPGGTAILNADDTTLQKRGPQAPCPVIWYSIKKDANVMLTNITYQPDRTTFTLCIDNQRKQVTTPIISAGLTSSLAAASAAAHALGINISDIAEQLRKLTPVPRTMELKHGLNNCTIIDDSYSASEGSVLNAIEHLRRFKSKDRRIALVPIIELGHLGPEVHQRLGKIIGNTKAEVYIYGHAYKTDIQKGYNLSQKRSTLTWHHQPARFAEEIAKDLSEQTVLLLEGRLPDVVHKALDI